MIALIHLRKWLLLAVICWMSLPVHAGDLLMVRSEQAFPEAMATLQNAIRDHGYTVSRVQRVDIGLTKSGFKTDKYRVVFFGKKQEIDQLTAEHPELIPYLPLQVAIFAEQEQTLLVASDPVRFVEFFPGSKLQAVFSRWQADLHSIFDDVRSAE